MSLSRIFGTLSKVSGDFIEISGLSPYVTCKDWVEIDSGNDQGEVAEIIYVDSHKVRAQLFESAQNIKIGQRAYHARRAPIYPHESWLGKVINYQGKDANGQALVEGLSAYPLHASPPPAIFRNSIGSRLQTGIAAMDCFTPLCAGQRLGLFAGSGVGKSTLLANAVKSGSADINVIALIGERGREVRHFIDAVLGPEGMARSIIIYATSDQSPAAIIRASWLSMSIAEYFRDQGKAVLYLFDSVTRFAQAWREQALASGETPSLHAYPPSTFRALSALCERAGPGANEQGTISALFSVLVQGSDMEEPIADAIRGVLDGHVILDRTIAERGRYPAIDILKSVSRSLPQAASASENAILTKARRYIAAFENGRDLVAAGLYVKGQDADLDTALHIIQPLEAFLMSTGAESPEKRFETLAQILDHTALEDSLGEDSAN